MTDEQLYNALQYGTGPTIVVRDINGGDYSGTYRAGYFNAKESGIINLDIKCVLDYENGVGFDDQSFSFFISTVLLHESVHYGNTLNGFAEGRYEYGFGWETCAYGMNIDDVRSAQIYLQKKQ